MMMLANGKKSKRKKSLWLRRIRRCDERRQLIIVNIVRVESFSSFSSSSSLCNGHRRRRRRRKKRQKVWRKMQTNTKPQNDDGRERERENVYVYTHTRRRKIYDEWIIQKEKMWEPSNRVISCISKNNNIYKMKEDAVLTSSRLHSLVLSIGASKAQPSSRCPHCRPLGIFFLLLSLSPRWLGVRAHIHTRRTEKKKRNRKKLLINI